MTPEAQRIAIAEACGVLTYYDNKRIIGVVGQGCFVIMNSAVNHLPDYLTDLNAMHAALMSQTQAFRAEFDRLLHATAEEKRLLVTELEAKDLADCFISCLQSQRDSGNSTP